MAQTNSVTDILEYAISRERQANILYNMMAELTNDRRIQQICLELAGEELEHKAKLELEMMKIGSIVKHNEDPAALAEHKEIKPLDYIADTNQISNMDITELLQMAIEKEQKSFRLYIDMATMVQDEESRKTLLALAEEEAGHRMRFEIEYNRLKTM